MYDDSSSEMSEEEEDEEEVLSNQCAECGQQFKKAERRMVVGCKKSFAGCEEESQRRGKGKKESSGESNQTEMPANETQKVLNILRR